MFPHLPSRVLGDRFAHRHGTARETSQRQRHDAVRGEGEDRDAVDTADVERFTADPVGALLDCSRGLEARQGDCRCSAVGHLGRQSLRRYALAAQKDAVARHCQEHDGACSDGDRIDLQGPGARHDVEEGAAHDRHDRQPLRSRPREALVPRPASVAKAPRDSAVAGHQRARREDEVHRLDRVRGAGEEPPHPPLPGQSEQDDAKSHGPDAA